MTTIWDNHWDQIPGNRTKYTNNFIHFPIENINEGEDTIFIRIYRPHNTKRAWRGRISNIEKYPNETYFKVDLQHEIEIPQNVPYYTSGWYLHNGHIETTTLMPGIAAQQLLPSPQVHLTNNLEPGFFRLLRETRDFRYFENYTAALLRILGLNEVYTNPPKRQAGLPDGFFKIRNIEVIYDAKLNENYLNECGPQISNYCNQLNEGNVNFGEVSIKLNSDNDKFVWIITRGETGYIKTSSNVIVKEVTIETLFKLYNKRLSEGLHQNEFENLLRNIERI